MRKKYIGYVGLAVLLSMSSQVLHAQQGFGTDKPAKSAVVHMESDKRGLLVPRVALASTKDVSKIATPAHSLLIYNTAKEGDVTPGFYYWEVTKGLGDKTVVESKEGKWVRFARQEDITAISTLAGDVTGPIGSNTVVKIQGQAVGAGTTANQVLLFNGTNWVPTQLTGDKIIGAALTSDGKITVGDGAAGALLKPTILGINPKSIEAGDIKGPSTGTAGLPGQVMVSTEDGTTAWKPFENIYTTDGQLSSSRTVTMAGKELKFVDKGAKGGENGYYFSGGNQTKFAIRDTERIVTFSLENNANAKSLALMQDTNGESFVGSLGGTKGGLVLGSSTTGATGDNTGITFKIEANAVAHIDKAGTLIAGKKGVATAPAFVVEKGQAKVADINKSVGAAGDRVVVADKDGVLKTVEMNNLQLPRMFYLPSVMVPTGPGQLPTTNAQAGVKLGEINLYAVYAQNFETPAVSSAGATTALPTWGVDQLEYHVGWYDKNVFENVTIDAKGVLKYSVKTNADVTMGSFFNIILKVKDGELTPKK